MRFSAAVSAVFALLGTVLLGVVVAAKSTDKKAAPPKPEELVGVWIGFWEDEEFTRLDLRADSTGYCAYVAPPESSAHPYGVSVYRVTRWSLDGWKLNVTLAPMDSHAESVYLKGYASFLALHLEIGGTSRKWKEKVVLRKESRMQVSNLETKTKMEEMERK